jgi:hypothetical protein
MQILLAVQTAMIGILEKPGSYTTADRVEPGGVTVNLQKNVLHQILGFAAVAQNARRDAKDDATVTVEELR